jgi:hypothetical protein
MFIAETPGNLTVSAVSASGLTPQRRMCTVPDHANAQSRN